MNPPDSLPKTRYAGPEGCSSRPPSSVTAFDIVEHHGLVRAQAAVAAAVSEAVGTSVKILGRTARGESATTFDIVSGDVDAILKVVPAGTHVLENHQRLVRLVDGLRRRGYPAPEYLAVGEIDEMVFTVQRRLPGTTLEPGPALPVTTRRLERVLPSILAAVDLQAGAGDLEDPPWPDWLVETNLTGGAGYCLHETMRRRSDTTAILERAVRLTMTSATGDPRNGDVVHFDLNPANILVDGDELTGIIDWNIPFDGAAQGDRCFDVATLLFYTYDDEVCRARLWQRALELSPRTWVIVYLAHLVLRQVEWTVRHRPGTAEEQRFVRIAERVLTDCEANAT